MTTNPFLFKSLNPFTLATEYVIRIKAFDLLFYGLWDIIVPTLQVQ